MADLSAEDLRRAPLFSELGRRDLGRLAQTMSVRDFPAGTEIATEGKVGVGFFVIDSGEASVSLGGREFAHLGPGDHFGDISLIVESPRAITVVARTDLHCLGMTSWDFRKLAEGNASVSWRLLQSMARRLVELGQVLEDGSGRG